MPIFVQLTANLLYYYYYIVCQCKLILKKEIKTKNIGVNLFCKKLI